MDEKNQEINTLESTIFTANEETPKKQKKKISGFKILIILLALLVALGGSIAAILLTNKDEQGDTESYAATTIKILNNNTIDVEKINLENKNGKLEFYATTVKTDEGNQNTFFLKGYDPELIADSYITSIADKTASLEALREMGGNGDYGFNNPNAIVKITGKNGLKDYGFVIGGKSPDSTGYYIKLDGEDKIYLIASSIATMFFCKPEDLTNNSLILPPNKDTVSAEYLSEGALAFVDKITISGGNYPQAINIIHTDNEMAAYKIISPVNRYATLDAVNGYLELLTSGITAQGCYKLNPQNADYETYGLTRPDTVIEIKYDKETVKIVAKKQESGNFALVIDNKKAIYEVSKEALTALGYDLNSLLNQYAFLEDLEDFKNITFNDGNKNYSFDISYNKDKNTTSETYNGKAVDDDLFRTYFDYYNYLKPELENSYNSGKTEFFATFTYSNAEKGKITVEFSKHNDRQYLVTIDGHKQGLIPYTYFDNLKNYLQNVINNKGIPNPA